MIRTSVAMATYNGAEYVVEQLESIRTQSMPVDEVIIHDDRSTDDTVAIVENISGNMDWKEPGRYRRIRRIWDMLQILSVQ